MLNLYTLDLEYTPQPDDIDALLECELCRSPEGIWRPAFQAAHCTWGNVLCRTCYERIEAVKEIARNRQPTLSVEPGVQILDWRDEPARARDDIPPMQAQTMGSRHGGSPEREEP